MIVLIAHHGFTNLAINAQLPSAINWICRHKDSHNFQAKVLPPDQKSDVEGRPEAKVSEVNHILLEAIVSTLPITRACVVQAT